MLPILKHLRPTAIRRVNFFPVYLNVYSVGFFVFYRLAYFM